MFFKRNFCFCSLTAFCAFAWLRIRAFVLFGAFWCFWCFWCVQNLFVKTKKGFKTALITSFILLFTRSMKTYVFFQFSKQEKQIKQEFTQKVSVSCALTKVILEG